MSDNITWMDGGFLFEINKQYNDLGQEAVLSNQQSILDLYQAYIDIGCKVITTNNYGFKPRRCSNWKTLCIESASIFNKIKQDNPDITILGSIPPFFPSYTYIPIDKEFKEFYENLLPVLAKYVDIFIIETSISTKHINCICEIATNVCKDIPIFVSFYPTHSPGNIEELLVNHNQIKGLFINCCNFDDMHHFYNHHYKSILEKHTHIQFGCYLNKIDEKKYKTDQIVKDLQSYKHTNLTIEQKEYTKLLDFSKQFHHIYIGGCCGYGVEEMKTLINFKN